MKRVFAFLAGLIGFAVKLAFVLGVTVLIAALALWRTVDQQFAASEVTVPDVRGLSEEDAGSTLAAARLGLMIEARRPHETVAPGLVAYQDPLPGASTRRQRMVKVVISSGESMGSMPSVVGRSRREAVVELKSAHVAIGQTVQVSAQAAPDTVLAQAPAAGTPVHEGSRVDLLVSLGPRARAWVMPDFRGRPAEAARELIAQAGLRVAQERTTYEPGVAPGFVRAQDPPPGTRVFREAAVSLTVSRGAEPPLTGGPIPTRGNP